ncbi:uncharacterized protein BJ212DRAFT_1483996 [Suillus subaureus]|uniref:DUF6533 domain-containing protein n=1 Tax=Suillus subaureus TaxID=48587 RepID=A0A9P7JAE3_9AGAM|nr:uncharacterized protein BJ212DRAFT_1483996 [Suillus subaureus]KAG1810860.1 hypothetical protein BJ212DRAFT_1483996 [Suillus subaureus]
MSQPTALYVDAGVQASKSTQHFNVGTFAVLIFDYFITLEAEWVWHRKWTFVRFIFTVSRYLPFFGIGMTFIGALRTQYYPGESCVRFGQASNVLHIICIIAAEGLLITRIYASWSSERLLTFLLVFPVVCFVVSYLISDTPLVFNSKNTTPINIPDPGNCLLLGGRNNVFEYAALLLYELVLLCLMLYIRFSKYGNAVGLLQETFFNDSVRYMMCIMVMSSFSIILTMVPPVTWVSITDSPQIVIHSVLASRILFNLRASERRSRIHITQTDASEIQFGGDIFSTVIFDA